MANVLELLELYKYAENVDSTDGFSQVTWKEGATTLHETLELEAVVEQLKVITSLQRPARLAEQLFQVPATINTVWLSRDRLAWMHPVTQTRTQNTRLGSGYPRYFPDATDNDFAVGDKVEAYWETKTRVLKLEAEVLEVHYYLEGTDNGYQDAYYGVHSYGAKVDFGGKRGVDFRSSRSLVTLTQENVQFKKLERVIPELEDVRVSEELFVTLSRTLEDPVAQAIYLTYRRSHIVDDADLALLIRTAQKVVEQLKAHPIPSERLALWFQRNASPHFEPEYCRFLVPYLIGEKVPTMQVKDKSAA